MYYLIIVTLSIPTPSPLPTPPPPPPPTRVREALLAKKIEILFKLHIILLF